MRKRITKFRSLIVALVIVLASVIIVVNRGFAYVSYSASYVIAITGDGASGAVTTLTGKPGLAKIDRDNSRAYFQRISTEEFNMVVTQFSESLKGSNLQVSSYLETPTPIFVFGSNQSIFALALIILAYVYRRYVYLKLPKQFRQRVAIAHLLAYLFTLLVLTGFVSLLSNFAMISETTIYLMLFAMLIVGTVYLFVAATIDISAKAKLSEYKDLVSNSWLVVRKQLLLIIAFVVVAMVVALGYKIVLDTLVLLGGVAISSYLLHYLVITAITFRRK